MSIRRVNAVVLGLVAVMMIAAVACETPEERDAREAVEATFAAERNWDVASPTPGVQATAIPADGNSGTVQSFSRSAAVIPTPPVSTETPTPTVTPPSGDG